MPIKCESYFDRFDENKRKSRFVSRSGSPMAVTYEYQYVDGIKQLVPSGETCTQDYIESFADECDLMNIITRFLNGDTSVLTKAVGTFGDFRDCPTTYAEIFDRVQKCKNVFNSMPVDIKEKFDNSYEKFWSEFGSDYFGEVFEQYGHSQEDTSGKDVKEVPDAE